MGLFNLFGGKKKDAKAVPAAAKESAPAIPEPARTAPRAADASPSVVTGSAQVKLRLKLAHSLRAGETAAAYQAAKTLAEIQARAGRRTGARIWREQAERIKAGNRAQAA